MLALLATAVAAPVLVVGVEGGVGAERFSGAEPAAGARMALAATEWLAAEVDVAWLPAYTLRISARPTPVGVPDTWSYRIDREVELGGGLRVTPLHGEIGLGGLRGLPFAVFVAGGVGRVSTVEEAEPNAWVPATRVAVRTRVGATLGLATGASLVVAAHRADWLPGDRLVHIARRHTATYTVGAEVPITGSRR